MRKKLYVIGSLLFLVVCCSMCRKAKQAAIEDDSNFDPRLSGGAATVFDISSQSFSNAIPGLSAWDDYIHTLGDKIFEQSFVAAPAPFYPGLGPVYNNVSCVSCHHNDGAGNPTTGTVTSSLLIRLSIPGMDAHGGPLAVPGFGLQLQDVAIYGVQPEGKVNISYVEQPFTFPDGEAATLRKPTYTLTNTYIDMPAGCMMSPRMAPPIFGLGLLDNLSEAAILANADPADANGDGIKGHANYTYNPSSGKMEIGRFGLKANTSNLMVQIASAFQQDMGITTSVFPQKSSYGQTQMNNYVSVTTKTDVGDSLLNSVKFYVQSLAVPARRNVTDAQVVQGEKLFKQINCSGCHIPTMYTDVNVSLPALSNQRIHPYTDLLLHDMGDDLADGRPDYQANGNEWKTPALWGIGLFQKTNGTPYYLHDGRARTLNEAILWHGGEAKKVRDQYVNLSKSDRAAVIAFLQSL